MEKKNNVSLGTPAEPQVSGSGNLENQLDEDFLFFLSLTQQYFSSLVEHRDIDLCQAWLNKLCGEKVIGMTRKRHRNIYLSNLILAMQEGQLKEPFERPPPEGPLHNPDGLFGPPQPHIEIEEPEWLKEVIAGGDNFDIRHHSRDGRVYMASKHLPNGTGAFGYLAVTMQRENDWKDARLADDWKLPPQSPLLHNMRIPNYSGNQSEDSAVPFIPGESKDLPTQLEELLSRRHSKPERKRLMRFYEDMMQSGIDELEGRGKANRHAEKLIVSIVSNKGIRVGDPSTQRRTLLEKMVDTVKKRIEVVKQREFILDKLQEKMDPGATEDDKIMEQSWVTMCQTDFAKRNLDKINALYPACVVERFLELLRDERMEMVKKQGKRYEEYQRECNKEMEAAVKDKIKQYQSVLKEWERICPAVAALKVARIKFEAEKQRRMKLKDDRLQYQNQSSAESEKHLEALLEEINKAQAELEAEMNQTTLITSHIEDTNAKIQRATTAHNVNLDADSSEHKRYRAEIDRLKAEQRDQQRRITQLEDMVKAM